MALICIGAGIALFGCDSSDTSTGSEGLVVNSASGRDNSRSTLDEEWDQIGIDHNRCMDYVDAWLIANYDSSWSQEETAEQVQGAVYLFMKDSTICDSDSAQAAILRASQSSIDYSYVYACVDTLVKLKMVSALEKKYLYRMVEIVFSNQIGKEALVDSVYAFVNDVKNVNWSQSEVVCIAITSILLHSAEYSQTTWTFAPPPPATPGVFSLGDMIKWDVGGGVAGGLIGGPGGILPGAGAASATYACFEVLDYFF